MSVGWKSSFYYGRKTRKSLEIHKYQLQCQVTNFRHLEVIRRDDFYDVDLLIMTFRYRLSTVLMFKANNSIGMTFCRRFATITNRQFSFLDIWWLIGREWRYHERVSEANSVLFESYIILIRRDRSSIVSMHSALLLLPFVTVIFQEFYFYLSTNLELN